MKPTKYHVWYFFWVNKNNISAKSVPVSALLSWNNFQTYLSVFILCFWAFFKRRIFCQLFAESRFPILIQINTKVVFLRQIRFIHLRFMLFWCIYVFEKWEHCGIQILYYHYTILYYILYYTVLYISQLYHVAYTRHDFVLNFTVLENSYFGDTIYSLILTREEGLHQTSCYLK